MRVEPIREVQLHDRKMKRIARANEMNVNADFARSQVVVPARNMKIASTRYVNVQ